MTNRKTIMWATIILVAVIVSSIVIFTLIDFNKSLTYEEKVENFVKENPKLKHGQIVFIGDSITAKYRLEKHYKNLSKDIYNRGISGDTTTWLKTRLQPSLLDLAPSEIVLMIGTNDINMGYSAVEIAENYENILQLIKQNLPNTKIYCISIIPQNTKYSSNATYNNAIICQTNEKIKVMASSYGFEYVDLYNALTDDAGLLNSNYTRDGLHLNSKGYRIWTNIMKDLLK